MLAGCVAIHTDDDISTKRLCGFKKETLLQHRSGMILPATRYEIANSIVNLF
jgi:hypothetical protein